MAFGKQEWLVGLTMLGIEVLVLAITFPIVAPMYVWRKFKHRNDPKGRGTVRPFTKLK